MAEHQRFDSPEKIALRELCDALDVELRLESIAQNARRNFDDPDVEIRAALQASEDVLTAIEKARHALAQPTVYSLPFDVVTMCKHRGWSMHWTHRGAYLHLEASELIEAIRGKRGDPKLEAADVLLVLMSITEYHGIPWEDVERQARAKCQQMMARPRYSGEEHDGRALGAAP